MECIIYVRPPEAYYKIQSFIRVHKKISLHILSPQGFLSTHFFNWIYRLTEDFLLLYSIHFSISLWTALFCHSNQISKHSLQWLSTPLL